MQSFSLRVYDSIAPPVAGGLATPGITTAVVKDITNRLADGFPRSITLEGDLEGRIVIRGEGAAVGELFDWFDNWIGYHVIERNGGKRTWNGFIYAMELLWRGDRDRRAILGVPDDEAVWNAVRCSYVAPSLLNSPELVTNGGFEAIGTGIPDTFFGWEEFPGTGTIAQNTTNKVSGNASCQLTKGASGDTLVAQYLPAAPGDYHLSFYTRGDGTNAGRYKIRNETASSDIVATTSTGVTSTSFSKIDVDFTVPSGCRSISIHLVAPSATGGSAGFDDLSLIRVTHARQLIGNGGFEGVGMGGSDIFSSWYEFAGTGTIAQNTLIKVSGNASCLLTRGATGNTFVVQNQGAQPGDYRLSFYARGDGTNAGRYMVKNETDATNIIALTSTGITSTSFSQVTVDFTVPDDCESFSVQLWSPSSASGSAYFDDVSLYRLEESEELAVNGGFEVLGAGVQDIFLDWTENAGAGIIARDTAVKNSGAASCRITFGGAGGQHIIQYLPLRSGQRHRLSFYTRGDGSVGGSYQVRDSTNAAAIIGITSTGITGTTWTQVTVDFTVPTNCREVEIYFLGPGSAGSAYFDDVSLKQYQDTALKTGWFTNAKSIARFGRKEMDLPVGVTNLANAQKEAARFLERRAWPWARPISSDPSQRDNPVATLEIFTIGYIATAMYRYIDVADVLANAASTNLNDLIRYIINTYCDFLTSTSIAAKFSGKTLSQDDIPDGRALEVLRQLTAKGTSDDVPTYFHVSGDRRAHYQILDLNPRYYRRKGRLSTTVGDKPDVSPRQARPGVIRRMDYPRSGKEQGSVLLDRRDMLVTLFEVDARGNLLPGNVSALAESNVTRYVDSRKKFNQGINPPIGSDGVQQRGQIGTGQLDPLLDQLIEELQKLGLKGEQL